MKTEHFRHPYTSYSVIPVALRHSRRFPLSFPTFVIGNPVRGINDKE